MHERFKSIDDDLTRELQNMSAKYSPEVITEAEWNENGYGNNEARHELVWKKAMNIWRSDGMHGYNLH